uniref:Translocon at the inner envelope membrane of chloroplasts 214 n=1 Tax=Nepenthes mirabilis TaxID=150983 RepID=A0A411JTX5_NEPMI|nr:hypothetical protein RF1 [Nepenthes mirabilis]QBC68524.1 hypothetical protein RF1 [Nepenthes mirabilis]QBC68609.1 hypothetical protein RF1 [Nepenthes mirabilis]QBC68696.1 hypothetical protein RF1 [Nepenthes mirabilis]
MIFKSFLLGNLVSLCMKIINSVVVVGLYYGFLTTFSIGPSYLFLLRAQVMEEPTEKKISTTTGFIMGQLMMLISIFYTPLHLALGRPHRITVLVLPYLLFHFFWSNHKHFFDDGPTTSISMRNLRIQYIFLNNLIFQLFNHFFLPSSMLVRLINIYMFQCNNKLLFVTSSFVGWLIGLIFFMKCLRSVLVWIWQKNSIRSTVLIQSNKYLVSELKNFMYFLYRIFSILLFLTCVYYLGRMPSPIFTKKLKEIVERKERRESKEKLDLEIEGTYEMKSTKKGFSDEDPSHLLFSEEKEDPAQIDEKKKIQVNGKDKRKNEFPFYLKETCSKNSPTFYLDENQKNSKLEILKDEKKCFFWFDEKPLVTPLFDYNRWSRPLRYIKNNRFENAVKNETSQYFFYTCQNDGKKRISFTYPPSLSTFWEMIQTKTPLYTTKKFFYDESNNYDYWVYTNDEKRNSIRNEFRNRIEVLDTGLLFLYVLEKKNRLCNDKTKKEYLTKKYDPLLNGPYRGIIKNSVLLNETAVKNSIDRICINKLHSIILNHYNCHKFEQKLNTKKSLSTEISYFLILISELAGESTSILKGIFLFPKHKQIDSKGREKVLNFLFDEVRTDSITQRTITKIIGKKEISKKVPQWSYKLIDDLEQQERENEEDVAVDHQIRSRKAKRVVIFTDSQGNTDNYSNTKDANNPDQADEVALIRYSQQSDFRRDIIKGSMRVQRRKIVIWELIQANVHSPIFLDRIDKSNFFYFDFAIFELIKGIFRKKNTKFLISNYTEEEKKDGDKKEEYKIEEEKRNEKARIEIAEAWDTIPFAQVIRGSMLVTQSILRKYIILPLFIIVKNISRLLLLQFPEWSEDIKEWNREMHVKCTYNGVQLSEKEFPKNWLADGVQIKILFPFCLKPWHRSKIRPSQREPMKKKEQKQKENFCFLTVWGMETELPFGSPRKRPSFFEPILKELEKKIRKFRKRCFLVITIFKERTKFFRKVPNETKKWILNNLILFRKKKLSKVNPIRVFGLREDSSEIKKEKDSRINNLIIPKSSIQTRSMDWTNFSLTEKKMKDLTDRTSTIRNQLERITKDKKNDFRTIKININPNKPNYVAKRVEPQKNFCQIVKRRNARLIRKSNPFFNFFKESIYIDIFLYIINIPSINTEPFLEPPKKIIDTYIYNNEPNQEIIEKKKKIHFISTIKKSLSLFDNNINKNSKIFFYFSFLSQAYVFYKLSQNKVLNLYKLRSFLQYHEIPLFLNNELKDSFRTQGLIHSQLKHKKLHNSRMKEWKNWLKSRYQYNLSEINWSRLIPQKWRNGVNQHCRVENQNLSKSDSYEKDQLVHYKRENDSEAYVLLLLNQKSNFKKTYRYDLLSYKSIYYKDKKDSYSYGSPFQVNKNQEIYSTYNYYNIHKHKLVDMWGNIPITNYLLKDDIMDMHKNPDRKYFDWRIVNFCLKKKVDIRVWIDMSTNSSTKNTKTERNNYPIFSKIDKKGLFYLTIHQEINPSNQKKYIFDWMGMNEEILNHPISNLELWFFPEFLFFSNAYKMKPWAIPIKSLFFNFNLSENVSENKNIHRKQQKDPFIPSTRKKSLELENCNEEEKKTIGQWNRVSDSQTQRNPESILSKEQKNIEQYYTGSDLKKGKKKKQYKSSTEAELDFFLKRYFLFQLRWDDPLNQKMINNIKVYCLLLRLRNPREIAISSIERREMNLDIMLIQKDLTLTELMKKGILIIEPVRLCIKGDGQFIIYQIIGISLVHKSKDQNNQKIYREILDKKNFYESIARHQKMTKNRDKHHYHYNYNLLSPENLFSPRRRRELRILMSFCFNSKNSNDVEKNALFCNRNKVRIKNCGQFFDESKDLDKEKNKLMKLKFYLWPNYRLEDLACMNRYWFDTTNGSRFSMLRIHMYPRLKIH